MFCKPAENYILTIRFKVFYYIVQIYDLNNDAHLLSSSEYEEEGSESEYEDD